MNIKNNAENLLNDSFESYYWLGFIMADGSVENTRIAISLSSKDKVHLLKLKKFLNKDISFYDFRRTATYGEQIVSTLIVTDKFNITKIRNLFRIEGRKTYNPPTLPIMSDEQFLSFVCGYIDGDGCINIQKGGTYTNKKGEVKRYERTDPIMQVKCHSSWENLLRQMGERLCKILDEDVSKSKIRIDKRGYVVWRLYGNQILGKLKIRLNELSLPKMERKWSKIQ